MTKKTLQYIFDRITDKSLHYCGYGSPWIHTDGRIYATNGNILLCLENTNNRSEAFTDNGERHPNVDRFIPPFNEGFKANHYVKLDALESFEGYCDLAGTSISDKVAKEITKILRLFGMEGVVFGKAGQNRLIFEIIDNDNTIGMILCADQGKETNTTLLFIDTTIRPIEAKLYDALIDDDKGKEYFKKCLKQDKEEQEKHNRENFKVFQVTLTKSKTICVKADTEEQAKHIALNNAYLIDFDNGCEVDDCEEFRKDDMCNYHRNYYSDKGKQNWED